MEKLSKGYVHLKTCIKNCVASAVMKGALDKDMNRIIKMDKKTLEILGKWKEL